MGLMYVKISKYGNTAYTLKSISTVCMCWCTVSQGVTLANQQRTEYTARAEVLSGEAETRLNRRTVLNPAELKVLI